MSYSLHSLLSLSPSVAVSRVRSVDEDLGTRGELYVFGPGLTLPKWSQSRSTYSLSAGNDLNKISIDIYKF